MSNVLALIFNGQGFLIESLAFAIPDDFDVAGVDVTLDKTAVSSNYTLKEGRIEIKLTKRQIINEDQMLEVTISKKEKP